MSIKNNQHAGFTLIEMVVVVVILAILGGIVSFPYLVILQVQEMVFVSLT